MSSASVVRMVCRILLVCMTCLPFQARAGLIGAGEAIAAAQAQPRVDASRDAIARFIAQREVAAQLQALGVSSQAASERVAALTGAEAAALAGRIESLPAGAEVVIGAVGFMLIIIFLVYQYGHEFLFPDPR